MQAESKYLKKLLYTLVAVIILSGSVFFTLPYLDFNEVTPTIVIQGGNNSENIYPVANVTPCIPKANPDVVDGVHTKGYGIFLQNEFEIETVENNCSPFVPEITTINQGVVKSGKYAGYNRLVLFTSSEGPDSFYPTPFFFITKDYKKFFLVNHALNRQEPGANSEQIYTYLDKRKVLGVVDNVGDKIDFPHRESYTFGNFVYDLYQINVEIPKNSKQVGVTPEGFLIFEATVKADQSFGSYGYSAYSSSLSEEEAQKLILEQKKSFDILKDYYSATTDVYIKDNNGVFAEYSMRIVTGTEFDDSVFASSTSSYVFRRQDIVTSEKLYSKYNQVTPTICGVTSVGYILKNVTASEVKSIGKTKNGTEIYTLTNPKNPILKAQYLQKVSQFTPETFLSFNSESKLSKVPTFEEYIAKNPVLIFKDNWGRIVAVGEFDYILDGGCGKPVIYLYPEKTTDIDVDFANPIQLTKDIPKYVGDSDTKKSAGITGWSVRANPDGILKNLNTPTDDCNAYKASTFGSEYAYEACVKNQYPYIYWAGNAYSRYPEQTRGFVVPTSELKQSLYEKLEQIGLSKKESEDMIEYWYPQMMLKNTPYYRISFIQTKEMDDFIPMKVTPKPDSSIRVFLDWEPLDSYKVIDPQILIRGSRDGFSYVEWGGLKR